MTVIITDAEYQELMRVKRDYEKLKKIVFDSVREIFIAQRNKILESWRWYLPYYKKKLSEIDNKIDKLQEFEELLK